MMFDQNLVVSVFIFGILCALIVFAYGIVVPLLLGRPRQVMALMDVILLALFIAVVILLMKLLGMWDMLVMHL